MMQYQSLIGVDAFNEWQQTSYSKDIMIALKEHILEIVQSELKSNSNVDAISAKITNKIFIHLSQR